ncbi:uncharacterized protein LOC114314962 [Camellia sinensis]|uniref:uncharacterized protein LOC114314962 n=1 Tax=Camellia sinensis TaxID=4442 RepID=UPI00103620FC|nr:uncharacterized protein LOC114314962 [Camellia sinensis]
MRHAKNLCNYQPSSMAFSLSSTIISHTRVSRNVSLTLIQPFFSTLLLSIRSKRTHKEHTVAPICPTLGHILAKNPSMDSLEDISYLLRIPQRKPYGTMEGNVKKALKKVQTDIIKSNLNPVWNKELMLFVMRMTKSCLIFANSMRSFTSRRKMNDLIDPRCDDLHVRI